jgi:hypothetical protein
MDGEGAEGERGEGVVLDEGRGGAQEGAGKEDAEVDRAETACGTAPAVCGGTKKGKAGQGRRGLERGEGSKAGERETFCSERAFRAGTRVDIFGLQYS